MHALYLFVGHTQGSTIVATAGSTLSKQLVTILNVRTQHHKLEQLSDFLNMRTQFICELTKVYINLDDYLKTCSYNLHNYLASSINTDYAHLEVYAFMVTTSIILLCI